MSKLTKNDDLFADSTMTFGEHLEELRGALFRSVVGLVIGFVIGLLISKHVVEFIKSPLSAALKEYYLESAMDRLDTKYKENPPPEHVATIRERGLIPEPAYIEPTSLLSRLKNSFPDQLRDVHVDEHFFQLEDIPLETLSGLCHAMIEARGVDDKPLLATKFSKQELELLSKVSQAADPTDSQRKSVLRVLNRLIENSQLHEQSYAGLWNLIEDARLRGAVDRLRELLAKDGSTDQSRRLNRLLLSGAFADYLPPAQTRVIEFTMWKPASVKIQTLGVHEGFLILVKSAIISGLVLSSPWVFYQLWTFVAAGLYPQEKRFVHVFLPFSLGLFFAGAALAFFFVFQPVLDFLLSFNRTFNISAEPRMSEWLSFVMFLPLGFGLSFQLPLVMLFLHRVGIFDVSAYIDKWRIAMLCIFVISMFLTPADPVSMLLMAVPLTFLYFGGVLLCMWLPKRSSPIAGGYEP